MQTESPDMPFSQAEQAAFGALAALIIPASETLGLPGADNPGILAVILADAAPHHAALAPALAAFAAMEHEASGTAFRQAWPGAARLVQTLVVQGYYRDDRVMRSLAIERRAPFPQGYQVAQGDWSLLDPVRARAALWRPTD